MVATTKDLLVTSSPHVSGVESVPKIMHTVWISLLPACLVAAWIFGFEALLVLGWAVVGCVGFEVLFLKMRGMAWSQVRATALDGSALVTGVLLALNLPASSPAWMVLVGALVAMSLGKHVFGGVGNNPFNPALVARVFLLISFPTQMITWSAPVDGFTTTTDETMATYAAKMKEDKGIDGATYATPLGLLKEGVRQKDPEAVKAARAELDRDFPTMSLFLGNMGGSLGEISVLALLLGALLLFWKGYITWHIPLTFVATTAAITGIAWAVDPLHYANPLFHVMSGGLVLGAFYMATDMVSSPVTARGMVIFGVGCGLITAVIRLWGAYPEGVSFAILIMNGLVPLIDKYTKPRKFGQTRRAAA